MIGEFFTINATNIGHAAMRAASRPIPQEDPAQMNLSLRKTDAGRDEIVIEVSTWQGFSRDIRISQGKIWSILQISDSERCRAACQHYIDDRAEHVRRAVFDAQACTERVDDSHLDAGSASYGIGGVAASEEQAHEFVMRPSTFVGGPATFESVLAYVHGFEAAFEMSQGRQPVLHQFSDLIKELKQELGREPTDDQTAEAIGALEPLLAKLFTAPMPTRLSKAVNTPNPHATEEDSA
ncbi:hypothetical protein AOZ07_11505 [Glutamicibacter halophytocola]|uniref:hypothetical protein n=1 Tax=Glutamicibacter halophytocola TaxID=1933880 RepID=UPI0006D4B8FF|nr:hypothetical protein [Glutamicibacter halophytocola]ALG29544.1 hypothetical protein AOZ07_11505 [Glutamicibacter halophytocola]